MAKRKLSKHRRKVKAKGSDKRQPWQGPDGPEALKLKDATRRLKHAGIDAASLGDLNMLRRRRRLSMSSLIDGLVMEQRPEAMLASVAAHLDSSGLNVRVSTGKHGIVIHLDSVPVALVCATHVHFRGGRRIEGDFLQPGHHWTQLRVRLLRPKRRRQSRASTTARTEVGREPAPVVSSRVRVLASFPDMVGPEAEAAALAASPSERIRTKRTLAFGHVVVLRSNEDQVRFEPITSGGGPVEAPFTWFKAGAAPLRAALRLRTPGDPLAIAFNDGVDESDLARAWLVGLAGFAELTCVEITEPPDRRLDRPPRSTSPGSRSGRQSPPRRPHAGARRSMFSAALRPIGATAHIAGSYVAGHRRRLRPGQRSSDEAKAAARAVGIELQQGETWVRPHARGLPEDAELQFSWRIPKELGIA